MTSKHAPGPQIVVEHQEELEAAIKKATGKPRP